MISLKKVARVICEWEDGNRGCTDFATFERPINYCDDDDFVAKAIYHFMNKGWVIATTRHLCPYCAAGRPNND